ncbi:MAG: hypothetical protein MZV63_09425 [Marinilabiliales bacterium]|nr:hypothetical protein [Marinilabiliales bacterium]
MKISDLRLYVNGRNLFLWTKMPNDGVGGDDPGFNYPTKKQINIGVNCTVLIIKKTKMKRYIKIVTLSLVVLLGTNRL